MRRTVAATLRTTRDNENGWTDLSMREGRTLSIPSCYFTSITGDARLCGGLSSQGFKYVANAPRERQASYAA